MGHYHAGPHLRLGAVPICKLKEACFGGSGREVHDDARRKALGTFRDDVESLRSEMRGLRGDVRAQARLRAFFRYAQGAGYIQRNPAADMSAVKVKQVPTLPLTPEQFKKLLDTIPEEFPDATKAARVHALIRCMRYTGLAIRDAVCLEGSKIQYDAQKKITRIVTARAKTGVDVSVPVPPDVAKEFNAVANGDPRYVFWQTGNGKPESAVTNWQHDLRTVFRKAGMPKGHPHQLRDTAAVAWLNAGIPLEEVSRLLGHSSIKTTEKHYSPWVKSRQDRLDSLVMATWKEEPDTPTAS